MIRFSFLILSCVVSLFILQVSFAATVINMDSQDHRIFIQGDARNHRNNEIFIERGKKIEVCPRDCFVTFSNGDCYALVKEDKVRIKNGNIEIQ